MTILGDLEGFAVGDRIRLQQETFRGTFQAGRILSPSNCFRLTHSLTQDFTFELEVHSPGPGKLIACRAWIRYLVFQHIPERHRRNFHEYRFPLLVSIFANSDCGLAVVSSCGAGSALEPCADRNPEKDSGLGPHCSPGPRPPFPVLWASNGGGRKRHYPDLLFSQSRFSLPATRKEPRSSSRNLRLHLSQSQCR